MVKTVFDNASLIHVWAQQSQERGRTHNGNAHFEGPTLFSYSTPIANFVEAPNGEAVCLITTERYSVTTTGKHMPGAHDISGAKVFYVKHIGVTGGRAPYPGGDFHALNLAELAAEYEKAINGAKRLREFADYNANVLRRMFSHARDYASTFELHAPSGNPEDDIKAIRRHIEERNARNNTPEAIARRAKEAERREKRKAEKERLAQLRGQERVNAWLAGENVDILSYTGFRHLATLQTEEGASCMLRAKGAELQTSWGARVPLDHAIRAFKFIKLVREGGQEWHRNGHTVRVGHFQIDRILPSGSFHAGCHFIAWQEVERVARVLGVFETPASDDAAEPSRGAA